MPLLWNHDRIAYSRAVEVAEPDGSKRDANPVKYDGEVVGYVSRAENRDNGWGFRLIGDDGRTWTVGFQTRADAADHLLSYRSPSAGWLA